MNSQPKTIGFIGAGNMAQALVRGILDKGLNKTLVATSDPDPEQRARMVEMGVSAYADNAKLVRSSDCVVIAVKPQVIETVLTPLASAVAEANPIILSIVAGINIARIKTLLKTPSLRIVRAMPNTPALVGSSATGLYTDNLTPSDKAFIEQIISSAGLALWVSEEVKLEAVTALSGSGPAYFLLLMEAMIDAGVALDLTQEQAKALTLQTARGTAELILATDNSPAELKRKVTSPGGTTRAALDVFEAGGFATLVQQAMTAACERAVELGRS